MQNKLEHSTLAGRLADIIGNNKLLSKLAYNLLVEEELNDKEIEEMRRSRCNKPCPYNNGISCTSCGCILAIKQSAKTNFNIHTGRIEITHCPEGFWDDANLAVYYKSIQ